MTIGMKGNWLHKLCMRDFDTVEYPFLKYYDKNLVLNLLDKYSWYKAWFGDENGLVPWRYSDQKGIVQVRRICPKNEPRGVSNLENLINQLIQALLSSSFYWVLHGSHQDQISNISAYGKDVWRVVHVETSEEE